MSEFRQDPITKNWVIIAPKRAKRPGVFKKKKRKHKEELKHTCPFCEGNEKMTPPEIMAFRKRGTKPNGPGWTIRVFENMFPALTKNKTLGLKNLGIYLNMNARGAHEIVALHKHEECMARESVSVIKESIEACEKRFLHLSKNVLIKHIHIIQNQGARAGASISHPHFQIFALPLIPQMILREIDGTEEYYKIHKSCVYCDMFKEARENSRVILENEHFIAFTPYASRSQYEVWILPKEHEPRFEKINNLEIKSLANIWEKVLSKLDKGLENPAYNSYIHTCPVNSDLSSETLNFYHWHIEILPKLSIWGGLELGTGVIINTRSPEEAAKFLRNVKVKSK